MPVLEGQEIYYVRKHANYKNNDRYHDKVDERTPYCLDCGRVWELWRGYLYYHPIPSIGKPRDICPKCKGNHDDYDIVINNCSNL